MHKFSVKSTNNERIHLKCKILDALSNSSILHDINAVIDTGATTSAISKKKAKELELFPLGKTSVHDAASSEITDDYYLNLYIEDFVIENIKVCTFPNPITDFVIGMDVLGQGSFSFKKVKGEYIFLYRISQGNLSDLNINNKLLLKNILIENHWNQAINLECEKEGNISVLSIFINCIDFVVLQTRFTHETLHKISFWKTKNMCGSILHRLRLLAEKDSFEWEIENISTQIETDVITPLLELQLINKDFLDESYTTYKYSISEIGFMLLNNLANRFGEIKEEDYL